MAACKSVPITAQFSAMIDRTKKLPARFYVTPAGRNPVREWILDPRSRPTHGRQGHSESRIWLAYRQAALCAAEPRLVGSAQRPWKQPDCPRDFLHG